MAKKVCLISFSDLAYDARSANLANTIHTFDEFELTTISIGKELSKVNERFIDVTEQNNSWLRWFFFTKAVYDLDFANQFDLVIASDLYSLPAAAKMANEKSVLIYDSREIYSKLGSLTNKPIRQLFISAIERKYINQCDLVYTTGELDSEYLRKYISNKQNYIELYNFPPYSEYLQSNVINDRFGLPDSARILIYQGVLHKGRGLEEAIAALPYLPSDYVLCIIGEGPAYNHYQNLVKSLKLELRVHFTGYVDYSELHQYTCSADLGLCLFQPISKSYELALPNKLFEYAMAGLPVIATKLAPLSEVIEKFKFGKIIPPFPKPELLAKEIEDIFDNNFSTFKENALASAKINCYEAQKDIILQILNQQKIKK